VPVGECARAVAVSQYMASGACVAGLLTFARIAFEMVRCRSPGSSVLLAPLVPLSSALGEPDSSGSPFLLCVRRTVVLRAGCAPPPRAENRRGRGRWIHGELPSEEHSGQAALP